MTALLVYFRHRLNLKMRRYNYIRKCLFIALGEQSALDLHCLFKRLHNISMDDKTYDCVVI